MSIVLLMANIYCVIIVREFHLFTLIHIYLLACSFWIHLFWQVNLLVLDWKAKFGLQDSLSPGVIMLVAFWINMH